MSTQNNDLYTRCACGPDVMFYCLPVEMQLSYLSSDDDNDRYNCCFYRIVSLLVKLFVAAICSFNPALRIGADTNIQPGVVQTLSISKSYINDLNYNSKCDPLQDQKILINSILTKLFGYRF